MSTTTDNSTPSPTLTGHIGFGDVGAGPQGQRFIRITIDAGEEQRTVLMPYDGLVGLLVAGFAIAARSMTSRCNNGICGDIDRGGQNSNCFEGRNDEKPEMAADSNEPEFRAFPAICLTASEHRQPGPGAETAFA